MKRNIGKFKSRENEQNVTRCTTHLAFGLDVGILICRLVSVMAHKLEASGSKAPSRHVQAYQRTALTESSSVRLGSSDFDNEQLGRQ